MNVLDFVQIAVSMGIAVSLVLVPLRTGSDFASRCCSILGLLAGFLAVHLAVKWSEAPLFLAGDLVLAGALGTFLLRSTRWRLALCLVCGLGILAVWGSAIQIAWHDAQPVESLLEPTRGRIVRIEERQVVLDRTDDVRIAVWGDFDPAGIESILLPMKEVDPLCSIVVGDLLESTGGVRLAMARIERSGVPHLVLPGRLAPWRGTFGDSFEDERVLVLTPRPFLSVFLFACCGDDGIPAALEELRRKLATRSAACQHTVLLLRRSLVDRGSEAGGTHDDLQRGILNVARELKIDLVVSGGGGDYAVSREGNLTHVSCGVPSGGSANWAEIQASPYELRVVRRSLTLQDSPAADHVFEVWLAAIREDLFALACLALAAGTPMLLILCGIGLLMGIRPVQETVVVGDVEDE